MLLDLWEPQRKPKSAYVTRGGMPASPPEWLIRLFGGHTTQAGVEMNETLALNLSAVYCALSIYAGAMKMSPLKFYRDRDDGGKDRIKNDPLGRLICRRPNPDMPASRFYSQMQTFRLLWGNAYAEKEFSRRGQLAALWPIHPRRVRVDRDVGGEVVYSVDGKTTYTREQMLHVPGIMSEDSVTGISVIRHARESMGMAVAAENYGSHFFKNGASPGGYIKRPADAVELDEHGEQELIESWMRRQGGVNRHMPAVLQEGAEWVSVGIPNEDAQFLETRAFQTVEVARWFNLPPHKLKDLSRATFSNIEHQAIEYLTDCLGPHYVDWQDELGRSFLGPDQDDLFFEFDIRGILWADHAARSAFYKALWEMGVLSINEIRALENLNPIGKDGDKRFVQLNLTTIDKAGQQAAAAPTTQTQKAQLLKALKPARARRQMDTPHSAARMDREGIKTSLMPIFVAAGERMIRREANAVLRAAAKYANDRAAFVLWASKFFNDQRTLFVAEFTAAVESLARLLQASPERLTAGLVRFAELHVQEQQAGALAAFDQQNLTNLYQSAERVGPAAIASALLSAAAQSFETNN